MKKERLERLRRELLREKKRLSYELAVLSDENLQAAEDSRSADDNYEDDIADSASNIFERERDISLERNVSDILAQVERALERMERGTYGICARCGREIDEERLRALPYAELCIDCRTKSESGRP